MKRFAVKAFEKLTLVVLAGLIAGGILYSLTRLLFPRLWIVNGFEVPVEVRIGGRRHTLAAGDRDWTLVLAGGHHIELRTVDGRLLASAWVYVPANRSLVVLNPLGAAVIAAQSVVYSVNPDPKAKPTIDTYPGKWLVVQDDIDYAFTEPPHTLNIKSGQSAVRRLFHTAVPSGWRTTAAFLADQGQSRAAARICEAAVELNPASEPAVTCALNTRSIESGDGATVEAARRYLAQAPDDFDRHRAHQWAMVRTGHAEQLRAFRRTLLADRPDSAVRAALLGRIEEPAVAVDLLEQAMRTQPDDLHAARWRARTLFRLGRLADSAEAYASIAKRDPDYPPYLADHVRALVALGRPQEAIDRAVAVFRQNRRDMPAALVYAKLASLPGLSVELSPGEALRALANALETPELEQLYTTLAGLPTAATTSQEPIAIAQRIAQAAGQDAADAWRQCQGANAAALQMLDEPTRILLALEFRRVGDEGLAARLLAAEHSIEFPLAALERYAETGYGDPDLWRLDPDTYAALEMVRARALQAASDPSAAAIYKQAGARLLLPGVVKQALEQWPHPEVGATGFPTLRSHPAAGG